MNNKFKPFLHEVSYNIWQVCYVNEDNYLCAKTYKGRHAEEFAKEDLGNMISNLAKQYGVEVEE